MGSRASTTRLFYPTISFTFCDITVPLKALFVITQSSINSPLISQLGCELEDGLFGSMIKTNNLKETTVEGVFAAGDIARALHNATWAAADGVSAGIFAHQSLIVSRNPYYR